MCSSIDIAGRVAAGSPLPRQAHGGGPDSLHASRLRGVPMISFRPTWHALGRLSSDLTAVASERWEIAPGETRFIAPARFLDGQLDLIQATMFLPLEQVLADFAGGVEVSEGPTYGFCLRDVDLVDGVLYTASGVRHLRVREHRMPAYLVPREVTSGAIYESWLGNRWFGNWLSDDCPRYLLAERFGTPITTVMRPNGHVPGYEDILGMNPQRIDRVHFHELILFEDFTKNSERQARADRVRARLAAAVPHETSAGVFLLRGKTGTPRILTNEAEIADRLALERGFNVLDPATAKVEEIIAACAGARVVAGVEGSHLVHGLAVMSPGSVLFVIQPPTRVTSVLKFVTDRQGLVYAFVVATGGEQAFSVEWEQVERTLDLALD